MQVLHPLLRPCKIYLAVHVRRNQAIVEKILDLVFNKRVSSAGTFKLLVVLLILKGMWRDLCQH